MNNGMPGIGIGVIIFNDRNEVLLILRNSDTILADSDMRLEGTWTLPAGKVKYGITLEESVKNKVLKEVNLEVDELELVSVNDDINEFAHFLTLGFVAGHAHGNISLGDTLEHIDYKYFPLDKLPVNLCEPSKKIIKNYLEGKIWNTN